MRVLILTILIATVFWDGYTTLFGNLQVLGEGTVQTIAAFLFTLLVLGFALSTRKIMQVRRTRSGFVSGLLMFFWAMAIFFDFFTSWIGNSRLVLQDGSGFSAYVILFGLTLLGASAPILLSILWNWALSNKRTKTDVQATA